jgi:hypothetical protein
MKHEWLFWVLIGMVAVPFFLIMLDALWGLRQERRERERHGRP